MVCILCDSKTRTTNSRVAAGGYQTWRRHTCQRCNAVFTTRESLDMSLSYRVEHTDGSLEAFSRDRLLLSILDALEHRKNYIVDAGILATTIITKLQNNKRLVIRQSDIIETCYSTLRRFNQGAAQIYMSRRVSR